MLNQTRVLSGIILVVRKTRHQTVSNIPRMARKTRLQKEKEEEARRAAMVAEEARLAKEVEDSTPEGKRIRNFTGDRSGLKDHLKGYQAITKDVLIDFRALAMASNADGEIPDSPPPSSGKKKKPRLGREKKKLGSSSKKLRRSAIKEDKKKQLVTEEEADQEEEIDEEKEEEPEEVTVEEATTDDDEDLTLKLQGNMERLPSLIRSDSEDNITALLTNPESQAVEALKKSVPDLTARDVTLFLYGYRLKGDHNVKTMETLLQSMSQCATVLASQNRNIKHTANALTEGVLGAKRTLSVKPEKPPVDKKQRTKMKEEDQEKDLMLDSIESILSYADKTPEDIFTLYDLSISQIYDALKHVIRDIGNQDYTFLDDSNWPHNLYNLFQEKKMEILKNTGPSKVVPKKKKK
ncbi:TPA_asm: protein 2 [Lolium perenne virus 1]|uniref:Protein 2 n=1 Tax=Lolium perenne virus 1 TaxID=2793730 RepID=A0A8D9PH20_9RHAB|nr:protein 2 [Lolium perenne virus 1]DAF42362.1 TPA_asm: protein 2 [Lolium perenne virus 1]